MLLIKQPRTGATGTDEAAMNANIQQAGHSAVREFCSGFRLGEIVRDGEKGE